MEQLTQMACDRFVRSLSFILKEGETDWRQKHFRVFWIAGQEIHILQTLLKTSGDRKKSTSWPVMS